MILLTKNTYEELVENLHEIYRANITEDGAIRNLVIDLKIERIWDVLYFKEEL